MIPLKNIKSASLDLPTQVFNHLGNRYKLSKQMAISIADNPTVETEENRLWFWINIGTIAYYRFGYVRDPNGLSFSFRYLQELDTIEGEWYNVWSRD